jgi:hypothetical protein
VRGRAGAAAGTVTGMDELCDDLLLLAVRPDGTLALPVNLRFGVSGAELVRLAAARRVDITKGRIVVLDTAPTGDALLDAALASMTGGMTRGQRGPSAKAWVARHRRGLVHYYLARAAAAGTIREERGTRLGLIPVTRWLVTDTARAAEARARLEAVAAGTGPVNTEQAALAGLATAAGVAVIAFPGRAGSAARKRLREAGKREPGAAAAASAAAAGAAADSATGAAGAATRAATDVATRAAMDAAVQAATDAAVSAAVNAATDAAVSAATEAAHSAAHHGGAAGGHH